VKVQAPAEPEQRSVTPILVGVGLIAVIGLGVVLTRKSEPTPTSTAFGGAASAAISAEPRPAPTPEASTAARAAESAPPAVSVDPGVVDINALGTAEPSAKAAPRASGAAHPKEEKGPEAPASATAPATSEPVASAAPRPMGSVGELHDEMKKRVGTTDAPEQPAETPHGKNPDAKQEKPSNAAVLGALGAVRGAVKACIEDTDKPTRISVTFQSDGSVRSVVVSGGAAGKPAEACVQAAVKKARVAPFMQDSFSTSFSVSP
jgi:predicted component of type VI protein secretion system